MPTQPLRVGLVNNMSDAAFRATQRQFVSLLDEASGDIPVQLSLYVLPGIARAEFNGHSSYASIETLWNTRLDGLIVTGREPTTADLRDEPYWGSFVQTLEWAQHNTLSAVWSCLAAHAAVLHMDDIHRRKGDVKHCGIFECLPVSGHWLTEGLPSRFHVPHSRWNGIAAADLATRGYDVVARTGTEIDTFVKQESSLFVFFQGHPEYESDTLLREYRRDVDRFLSHQSDNYPSIPRGYFDSDTESFLDTLRRKALATRDKYLLADLTSALTRSRIDNAWRSTAANIYRNWLEHLCARKSASPNRPSLNPDTPSPVKFHSGSCV
jgi:homoserine O-succinyltransferase